MREIGVRELKGSLSEILGRWPVVNRCASPAGGARSQTSSRRAQRPATIACASSCPMVGSLLRLAPARGASPRPVEARRSASSLVASERDAER